MVFQQKKPRETVTARIEKIWDDPSIARGMQLSGFGRMGAAYQKTLQDVTEGGALAEGLTVTVEYTVNGQYKNAERIVIDSSASAPAPTTDSGGDPMAKGGKASRVEPNRYRHPDEATRIEALSIAVSTMAATGELAAAGGAAAVVAVTDLAELYQAFIEDQIDATWIKANVKQGSAQSGAAPAPQSKPEPEPTQQEYVPSPEAQAAAAASAQPGPADTGQDAMSRWMSGE